MNLITDDKRAFEYNYSHVSAKRKETFSLKMAYLLSGYQQGYYYLVGLESFKKINSPGRLGRRTQRRSIIKISALCLRYAADESGTISMKRIN